MSRIEEAPISSRKVQREWEKIVDPCHSSLRLARERSALIEQMQASMLLSSETPFKRYRLPVPQTDSSQSQVQRIRISKRTRIWMFHTAVRAIVASLLTLT